MTSGSSHRHKKPVPKCCNARLTSCSNNLGLFFKPFFSAYMRSYLISVVFLWIFFFKFITGKSRLGLGFVGSTRTRRRLWSAILRCCIGIMRRRMRHRYVSNYLADFWVGVALISFLTRNDKILIGRVGFDSWLFHHFWRWWWGWKSLQLASVKESTIRQIHEDYGLRDDDWEVVWYSSCMWLALNDTVFVNVVKVFLVQLERVLFYVLSCFRRCR